MSTKRSFLRQPDLDREQSELDFLCRIHTLRMPTSANHRPEQNENEKIQLHDSALNLEKIGQLSFIYSQKIPTQILPNRTIVSNSTKQITLGGLGISGGSRIGLMGA